jgi:hypothetical protein
MMALQRSIPRTCSTVMVDTPATLATIAIYAVIGEKVKMLRLCIVFLHVY